MNDIVDVLNILERRLVRWTLHVKEDGNPDAARISQGATSCAVAFLSRVKIYKLIVWNLDSCNGRRRERRLRKVSGEDFYFDLYDVVTEAKGNRRGTWGWRRRQGRFRRYRRGRGRSGKSVYWCGRLAILAISLFLRRSVNYHLSFLICTARAAGRFRKRWSWRI